LAGNLADVIVVQFESNQPLEVIKHSVIHNPKIYNTYSNNEAVLEFLRKKKNTPTFNKNKEVQDSFKKTNLVTDKEPVAWDCYYQFRTKVTVHM
jgi:hypothetical protein